ncbi:MAG: hypothetical protein AB7F86_01635 [Bdellovibrionales bacterium]
MTLQQLRSATVAFLAGFLLSLTLPVGAATLYYDQRPDILDVGPSPQPTLMSRLTGWLEKSRRNPPPDFSRSVRAYPVLLAQIMAFFPEDEYYFLARDIEYLYDTARVIFKDDPNMLKRFHLLPLGRRLVRDPMLNDYLATQGLTKDNLGNRSVLAIDSCCIGTIPDFLARNLETQGIDVRGFLVTSSQYPSSKVYERMGAEGPVLEEQPHYTGTAIGLDWSEEGRFRVRTHEEGANPEIASSMMERIRDLHDNDEIRRQFFDLKENMSTVFRYLTNLAPTGHVASAQASKAAQALVRLRGVHHLPIYDFLDDALNMNRKNYVRIDYERIITLRTLSASMICQSALTR